MVWYVLEDGAVRHLSNEEFQLYLSAGRISPAWSVWTDGMPKWVAASELFPGVSLPSKAPRLYPLMFCIVLVACISVVSSIARETLLGQLIELVGLVVAITIIGLISVLLTASGCYLAIKAWDHPIRRKASRRAGLLFLFAAVTAFCQVVILFAFFVQAPDVYRMLTALENYANASITSTGEGSASIVGTLGPHLMKDFMKMQETSGPITTVQITSPGGLLTPAMELARYFETQKTTVLIVKQCSSACILLAVASPHSYANADAWFGFHHTYPVAEAHSEIVRYSLDTMWREYRAFLASHGVPETVLIEAAKHDATSVHLVSAPDMLEYGAIKGVLSVE